MEGLCLAGELFLRKAYALLGYLLVVRYHLLAIHSNIFLLI